MPMPLQHGVTGPQAALLKFIISYTQSHCYQPSRLEMAAHMGVFPRAVVDSLGQLERKGLVHTPLPRMERAVELPWARFQVWVAVTATHVKPLSDAQRQLVLFILKYVEDVCHQPSREEMGEYLGVSPPEVAALLSSLEQAGVLRLPPDKAERAVEFPWARMALRTDPDRLERNAADVRLA